MTPITIKHNQAIFTPEGTLVDAARNTDAVSQEDGFQHKTHYVGSAASSSGSAAPVLEPGAQLTPAMTEYILAGLDTADFSADKTQQVKDAITTLNTNTTDAATQTKAWRMPTLNAEMALIQLLTEVMSEMQQASIKMQSTNTTLYSAAMKANADELRTQGRNEIAKSITSGGTSFILTGAGARQNISGIRKETNALGAQEGFKTYDEKTSKLQNNLYEVEKLNATELSSFKAANPTFDVDIADKDISANARRIADAAAKVTANPLDAEALQRRVATEAATAQVHLNANPNPPAEVPAQVPVLARAGVPAGAVRPPPQVPQPADIPVQPNGANAQVDPNNAAAQQAAVGGAPAQQAERNDLPPQPVNPPGNGANPHMQADDVPPAQVVVGGAPAVIQNVAADGVPIPVQPAVPAVDNTADAPSRLGIGVDMTASVNRHPATTQYQTMVSKQAARLDKATQDLANHKSHGGTFREHEIEGIDGTKYKKTATEFNKAHPEAAERGRYNDRLLVSADIEGGKTQQAWSQVTTHGATPLATGVVEGTTNNNIKASEAEAAEASASANLLNTGIDQEGQRASQSVSARDGFRQLMTEIRNANQTALDAVAANMHG